MSTYGVHICGKSRMSSTMKLYNLSRSKEFAVCFKEHGFQLDRPRQMVRSRETILEVRRRTTDMFNYHTIGDTCIGLISIRWATNSQSWTLCLTRVSTVRHGIGWSRGGVNPVFDNCVASLWIIC